MESIFALTGRARMSVRNLPVFDYFDNVNAVLHTKDPVRVPATCSFDIQWSGPVTKRGKVTSPAGSAGELLLCQATMQWSASNGLGFKYQSDPHGTTSAFAQLGHVRNGIFAR